MRGKLSLIQNPSLSPVDFVPLVPPNVDLTKLGFSVSIPLASFWIHFRHLAIKPAEVTRAQPPFDSAVLPCSSLTYSNQYLERSSPTRTETETDTNSQGCCGHFKVKVSKPGETEVLRYTDINPIVQPNCQLFYNLPSRPEAIEMYNLVHEIDTSDRLER